MPKLLPTPLLMKSRSIVLLPLLGCLWLLAFLPALAQSPAARRSQVVSYRAIPGPEPEDQLLDQCVLFGDGTSRRE